MRLKVLLVYAWVIMPFIGVGAQKPLFAHDPVMAFEDGTYHLFSTGRGVQHAVSKDLVNWELLRQPAMGWIPKWTRDSVPKFRDHVWAPDIIKYDGKWWMSYSCSTFGKRTSAIGLLSTESLKDSIIWKDEGPLVCSNETRDFWNAIDPNFIVDENGEPWLTWGSFWGGIQLARLDKTMHLADGKRLNIANRRTDPERANPIEAPFIYRHGDWFYLFVSWDYCCKGEESTYKVAVGRSKHVYGPYLDKDGKDMRQGGGTIVIQGDDDDLQAAGHCSVYNTPQGEVFLCHGYSRQYHGMAVLVTKDLTWTADGWPILSNSKFIIHNSQLNFEINEVPGYIRRLMTGKSMPKDAAGIDFKDLRYLTIPYYNNRGEVKQGEMVVNKAIAEDVIDIFKELFRQKYQIGQMRLIDCFDADDEKSMQANNTSAFCYRSIKGTNRLSKHSLGMAIDLNPLYNPCVKPSKNGKGKSVQPATAKDYTDRKKSFPHKLSSTDLAVKLFKAKGFKWGGDWKSSKDYQHFEK